MDSLGTLYLRLINELQLVHNSEMDKTCNILSFMPDLQSFIATLFPIGTSSLSVQLSQLSVVKLYLELILSTPKSATSTKNFNTVFLPGFLDSLLSWDQFDNGLTMVHMLTELTSLFLFATHVLGVTAHLSDASIATYLDRKCLSTDMKIRVVNSLCKLQKNYNNESFDAVLGDVFGILIWNRDMISTVKEDGMFFVKLSLGVLSTSSVDQIRVMMLQDFEFFFESISIVESVDLRSCLCMFLNELFPCYRSGCIERSLVANAGKHALNILKNSDYVLLHGVDIPATCTAILRFSLWVLDEGSSSSHEKHNVELVFAALERFKITAEDMIKLCIEEDEELINFLLLHLDLFWIVYKRGMSDNIHCPLVRIKPWDLLVELMLKLSFDESVLNDWLISNETHFLRYFVKLCKILRLFWQEFNHTCSKISEIQRVQETLTALHNASLFDACMSSFIRLKLKIVRLHNASLYPYSPEPLIKLLASLEDMYG